MNHPTPSVLTQFTWHRQPAAERLVRDLVADFLARSPEAARLAARMTAETGTRFADWVDYVEVWDRPDLQHALRDAGFVPRPEFATARHVTLGGAQRTGRLTGHVHPGGVFPTVLLVVSNAPELRGEMFLGLKVESVADFAAANQLELTHPAPLSVFREEIVAAVPGASLGVVERHGYRGFAPAPTLAPALKEKWLAHLERFRTRRRSGATESDEEQLFGYTENLIDAAITDLGQPLACDLFFAAEREYWQRRNRAARFQKARQDALGLGWANHDHHTYRSSRRWFSRLIGLWEKLGFELRERFYAGAEAGWGAQVAEHPVTGIVTFNDVDLSPEELMEDFSHNPLPDRHDLGTVGLWCALHGESVLQAGMHHLECQFDFDTLRAQMEQAGLKTMNPFTDFPHLRQAFTEGERWPVNEDRLTALLENNQITPDQAAQFRQNGALGSHLENLERNEGFKGFNQKGVSEIISKTDPRKQIKPE